jgi:hypothetical protein
MRPSNKSIFAAMHESLDDLATHAVGDLGQLALLIDRRLLDRADAEIDNSLFNRKSSRSAPGG